MIQSIAFQAPQFQQPVQVATLTRESGLAALVDGYSGSYTHRKNVRMGLAAVGGAAGAAGAAGLQMIAPQVTGMAGHVLGAAAGAVAIGAAGAVVGAAAMRLVSSGGVDRVLGTWLGATWGGAAGAVAGAVTGAMATGSTCGALGIGAGLVVGAAGGYFLGKELTGH